jgi:hypothetical protein
MTTLQEQLEMMREKMRLMADNEQKLVRGLGEALNVADERLREQVRQFAMEHNQRRSVALDELRSLSARLGSLPKGRYDTARQPAASLEAERYGQQRPQFPQQQPPQQAYQPPQGYPQQQPGFEQAGGRLEPTMPDNWGPPGAPGGQQPTSGDWRRAASRIEEEISAYQSAVKRSR